MGGETMSEKEATDKQIIDALNKIMESVDEKIDETLPQAIRLFAKLIFNLRFDLNELKLELIKCLGDIGIDAEINHKPEEEDGRFYS